MAFILHQLLMLLREHWRLLWLVGEATILKTFILSGNMRKFEHITMPVSFMKRLNSIYDKCLNSHQIKDLKEYVHELTDRNNKQRQCIIKHLFFSMIELNIEVLFCKL